MDKPLLLLHKARPGIGGIHCPCCNPAFGKFRGPGSRQNRQAAKRALRRTQHQQDKSAGANELHQLYLDWKEEYNQFMIDFGMEDSCLT